MHRLMLHPKDVVLTGFVLLNIAVLHIEGATCPNKVDGVKTFGSACEYLCHCVDPREQCEDVSGNCTSGCTFEWTGRGCQYKNIAQTSRVKRHIDNVPQKRWANFATDKNNSTCSETATAESTKASNRPTPPWWRIWWQEDQLFRVIVISTRQEKLDYFNKFIVYVENTPAYLNAYNFTSREICYEHDGTSRLAKTMTVTCGRPLWGNQVRIQLDSKYTQLVLCDVRMFGECHDYECGTDCSIPCHCAVVTFNNSVTGDCLEGCAAGWTGQGHRCDTECSNGTYGDNCSGHCSGHCKNNAVCDKVYGHCPQGCAAGWTGDMCETECDNGKYGTKCLEVCSGHCVDNGVCDKVDGHCLQGCAAGWRGVTCDTECDNGKYGTKCLKVCSGQCVDNGVCDKEDGHCPQGCAAGWRGDMCETECTYGTFGENCTFNCSDQCEGNATCNHVNGSCVDGCEPGWTGSQCVSECDNGRYGDECLEECSNHCVDNDVCDKKDGHCARGCAAGWMGDKCSTECMNDTYGLQCSYNCSKHCLHGDTCARIDGHCPEGCELGWLGSLCDTEQALTTGESQLSLVGPVVGSVVGVLLVASGLIIGVVFYKSRHNKNSIYQQSQDARTTQETSQDNVYMNSLATGVGKESKGFPTKTDKIEDSEISLVHNECQYYNMDEKREAPFSLPQHGIYISQLMTFLLKQSENNRKLVSEFEEIPTSAHKPNTNAMKYENRKKNRYKIMYPYDFNRVVLEPDEREASDYINASYVDGYKHQRAYIAAQGPTQETINDFWRLIWQQKTQIVVIVTQLYENEKMKCEQYWDPSGPVTFGDITVTVISEEQFAEFTIRKFKAQSAGSQSSLLVQQYHYTAWPDKACPDGAASLLCFWGRVNKDNPKTDTPWLVHCSAGVGRTGTFIALDILISQGRDTGYVDVYGCVEALRQQRVYMVQTKDQYIYLHELLVDALVLEALPMLSIDYMDMNNTRNLEISWNLCQKADRISRGKLYPIDEYDTDVTFKAGLTEENLSKNRDVTIIPENMYRPFLSVLVDGSTNYINAVNMPSYRRKHGFILTQTPLPTTTADWWRLVHQHKINTVLAIDDARADEEVGQYLPSKERETIGTFRVDRVSKEGGWSDAYFIAKYQATYKEETHKVTHITYKQWSCDDSVPTSRQKLLQLCNDVIEQHFTNQGTPLLIQCRDGATRSGMMAVLLYALDRLRVEKEVAVLQILRHLRLRRPEIVPNMEQFLFINTVIKEQIENSSTYANI